VQALFSIVDIVLSIRHLKIRPRLLLGFTVVGAILCAACAFALFQMSRIEGNLTDLKDNWFPAMNTIGNIDLQIGSVRRNSLSILLAQDQEGRAQEIKGRQVIQDKLRKLIDQYEKMADSGKDRDFFERDKAAISQYLAVDDSMVNMAAAGNADFTTIRNLANTTTRDALFAADAALHKHLDFIGRRNDEAGRHATEAYKRALIWTVAAILLAFAVALWVAHTIAESITRPIQRALTTAEAVSKGDLTLRPSANIFQTETGQLNRALGHMLTQLTDIVTQVRQGSEVVLNGASEIAAGNENLSQRTEEQAAAVEQTMASIQHLTTLVQSSAESAQQGMKLAQSTSDLANQGGQVMGEVVTTMTGISDQSSKVSDIINTIEGIAFQTNILALNAAIEAARAGQQGRGFAVVAGEVRALSQRSAAAAKEIKDLVMDSVSRINAGSSLVNGTGSKINEVVVECRHVSELMTEITSASNEGHQGIVEVNKAIGEIDTVTQHNAALVEQAAAAARNVHEEAERLLKMVSVFRIA
jgi:methyl-accepting chemotaxis protein